MTFATPTVRLRGISASPGLAHGPLVHLDEEVHRGTGPPVNGTNDPTRLREAIHAACTELTVLMNSVGDGDAKALLAFQIAMLQDPVLSEPAFSAMTARVPLNQAWRDAIEMQIRHYDSAADPYFRARAIDLRDMRDRVSRMFSGIATIPIHPGSIVIGTDLPPSRFLEISWGDGGIALIAGSTSSHVAMLARARGVPMLIGLEPVALLGHGEALLDADNGMLIASPDEVTAKSFGARQRAHRLTSLEAATAQGSPAVTASGERVEVLINVADGAELADLNPAWCDGVGLVRSELLLRDAHDLMDEAKQYEAYCHIIRWAEGRPVTVRLLDAGGDKSIPGYTVEAESNPFLGMRGVRLSLLHPQVLNTQLRALARAAARGPLQIMVPMVTWPREFDQVCQALSSAVESLGREGLEFRRPALGMMLEVPAAALSCEQFEAAFFSIGSNDLIQYLTACSRDSRLLAELQDPLQPTVLGIMREIVRYANTHGIPVSLCGDMASDPRCIPALLEIGLRRLSVAPAALASVKATIAQYRSEAPTV